MELPLFLGFENNPTANNTFNTLLKDYSWGSSFSTAEGRQAKSSESDSWDSWHPYKALQKARVTLEELETTCRKLSTYSIDSLNNVSQVVAQPAQYETTNLDAYASVKLKHQQLQIGSEKLRSMIEEAQSHLQKASAVFFGALEPQAEYEALISQIRTETRGAMNSVHFSSTENLQILPMTTISPTTPIVDVDVGRLIWFLPATIRTPIPGKGFFLKNGLPPPESEQLIRLIEDLEPTDVALDDDPRYRSNHFVMGRSQALATQIWDRIKNYLGREEIIQTKEGLWKPSRVNEIINFTKYLSGTPMLTHIPGPWVSGEVYPAFPYF